MTSTGMVKSFGSLGPGYMSLGGCHRKKGLRHCVALMGVGCSSRVGPSVMQGGSGGGGIDHPGGEGLCTWP
eukprot:753656-Hanusia_phi.AAC.22